MIKILMAAAEAAPFAKAGGLADVMGSLPPALKAAGCDARIIIPKYGSIDEKKYKLRLVRKNIEIPSGRKLESVDLWEGKLPGAAAKIYFIENEKFFGRPEIYWGNNAERFLFFSLAALYVLPILKFIPDIFHCHDYHAALATDLIKTLPFEFLKNIKTVYTIHNLNYQGLTEVKTLSTGDLSKNSLKTLSRDAQNGDINFMAQGILNADAVTTVSKSYAKEITTSLCGGNMNGFLKKRQKDLYGILNGIDTNFFNPQKDKFIKKRYSAAALSGKTANKIFLQKKLGLPAGENIPLFGLVSRFVWQKGLELITENLMNLDAQFVFLGTGQKKYENHLKRLAKKFPKKASANIAFNLALAQQIYAGADIFLMPSRFEPCGLGQMIAMRYGTLPLARSTGGLADTINLHNGFKFSDFDEQALIKTAQKALSIYYNNKSKWKKMQIRAIKTDFSWNKSAKEYVKLYKKVLKNKGYP